MHPGLTGYRVVEGESEHAAAMPFEDDDVVLVESGRVAINTVSI
jgi:hypothetical protein